MNKGGNMKKEEMIRILKEIKEGKEGQSIPYDIIIHGIQPLQDRACLHAAIYLLEQLED